MIYQSVKGVRLPDVYGRDQEMDIYDMSPGSWRWRLDGPQGKRVMEAVLPQAIPGSENDFYKNLVVHCLVNQPNHKGYYSWNWDGDEDLPTLTPSIGAASYGSNPEPTKWHGYLTAGEFKA